MNIAMSLMILGMLISYPTYFYLLNEFRFRLKRDHPALWAGRVSGVLSTPWESAYKALREVRRGCLDGITLSKSVLDSHRDATRLLYLGMFFFLGLLFLGLYDSVWGAGS